MSRANILALVLVCVFLWCFTGCTSRYADPNNWQYNRLGWVAREERYLVSDDDRQYYEIYPPNKLSDEEALHCIQQYLLSHVGHDDSANPPLVHGRIYTWGGTIPVGHSPRKVDLWALVYADMTKRDLALYISDDYANRNEKILKLLKKDG